jgi:TctA family transporter
MFVFIFIVITLIILIVSIVIPPSSPTVITLIIGEAARTPLRRAEGEGGITTEDRLEARMKVAETTLLR